MGEINISDFRKEKALESGLHMIPGTRYRTVLDAKYLLIIITIIITDRPMCDQPPALENGAFHINGNGTIKAGFVAVYK